MTFLLFLVLAFLTPCASEDANLCYWNASANGNNGGTSFVAISDDLFIPLPTYSAHSAHSTHSE